MADVNAEPVPVNDLTAADFNSFEFGAEKFDVTAAIPVVDPIQEHSYVDRLSRRYSKTEAYHTRSLNLEAGRKPGPWFLI